MNPHQALEALEYKIVPVSKYRDLVDGPVLQMSQLVNLMARGGAGPPKFNQLQTVTTCTYRPSLVKIDAHNFELSW